MIIQNILKLILISSVFIGGCSFLPKQTEERAIIKTEIIEKRYIVISPKSCGMIETPSANLLFNLTWFKTEGIDPKNEFIIKDTLLKLKKSSNQFDCSTTSWGSLAQETKFFFFEKIYLGKVAVLNVENQQIITDIVINQKESKRNSDIGEFSLIQENKGNTTNSIEILNICYKDGCLTDKNPENQQITTYTPHQFNFKLN